MKCQSCQDRNSQIQRIFALIMRQLATRQADSTKAMKFQSHQDHNSQIQLTFALRMQQLGTWQEAYIWILT